MEDNTFEDATYFSSYEDIKVHELMLRDGPRMEAYWKAMELNASYIKGKVVLDVGSGTGILSMFAAKHGAKCVYAVEASNFSDLAEQVIEENDLKDVVKVIHGRIEEIELPEKVDVIVSEWMGFYLLHESMLPSVLYARDHWLKEGGHVFPRWAILYACPTSLDRYYAKKLQFWDNIYGFKFNTIKSIVSQKMLEQPVITTVHPDQLLAEPQVMQILDIEKITENELTRIAKYTVFEIKTEGTLHGMAFWFDVIFSLLLMESKEGEEDSIKGIALSTNPSCPKTHWKQTVVPLPGNGFHMTVGTQLDGTLIIENEPLTRKYNLSLALGENTEEEQVE